MNVFNKGDKVYCIRNYPNNFPGTYLYKIFGFFIVKDKRGSLKICKNVKSLSDVIKSKREWLKDDNYKMIDYFIYCWNEEQLKECELFEKQLK